MRFDDQLQLVDVYKVFKFTYIF